MVGVVDECDASLYFGGRVSHIMFNRITGKGCNDQNKMGAGSLLDLAHIVDLSSLFT